LIIIENIDENCSNFTHISAKLCLNIKPEVDRMNKLKILAIAPYNGLKELINDIAHERKDVDVHTFVADMLDGMELVKSIQHKDYDAIISRAGTAEIIQKVTDLPVVDIKLSVIDMMRAIKLAQQYSGKFAIVGYKVITETASIICEILQYNVEIKTISSMDDISDTLSELKASGVSLIVGDAITTNNAKKMGLNIILVTSGRKSVLTAFNEVFKIQEILLNTQRSNSLIKNILKKSSNYAICFNMDKQIIYSSIHEDIEDSILISKEIEELIDVVVKEEKIQIIKKIGNSIVNVRGELIEYQNYLYPTFYLDEQRTSIKPFDDAISYKNFSDSPMINFESFYTSSDSLKSVINYAKAYAPTQQPIILFGDNGTGKNDIVHAIYHNSHYNKNPLVVINCKYMNEKKWSSIFESENSLFTNSNLTIFIKNLHFMDEISRKLFERYFSNTFVHKRNRFIFSCVSGYSKAFDNSDLLFFIRNELNAFPLILPNLNNRKEDLPSLASLYLSELNQKYGKQVTGLENGALKLLQEHNWINNIIQFKRVIEELLILTDSFYIKEDTVKLVLSNENISESYSYNNLIDLNQSLEEINKNIINLVLSEEKFNQSKAAERLGISRSTLWRKIK